MLEYALRQERSKYYTMSNANAQAQAQAQAQAIQAAKEREKEKEKEKEKDRENEKEKEKERELQKDIKEKGSEDKDEMASGLDDTKADKAKEQNDNGIGRAEGVLQSNIVPAY